MCQKGKPWLRHYEREVYLSNYQFLRIRDFWAQWPLPSPQEMSQADSLVVCGEVQVIQGVMGGWHWFWWLLGEWVSRTEQRPLHILKGIPWLI